MTEDAFREDETPELSPSPESSDEEAREDHQGESLGSTEILAAAADETLVPGDEVEATLPSVETSPALDLSRLEQSLDQLSRRLDARLDELGNRFEREVRAEATREKVVDRLHAELQEYKQDLLLNTLRPVFLDLIQLHDDIGKVAVAPPTGESGPSEEVARLLELMRGFQQGIEDILYRQGVEPLEIVGVQFDPRRQRAVSTVPTDDPERNKQVAARLRKGFASGDRVIRPEIVSVYALKRS